jgi:hypothetical protein
VARKQACLWRALAAKARSAAPYRRRVTTFLTALIASSVANAVEFDGRKIDSSSRSEVAPAEGDGEVKRRLGR